MKNRITGLITACGIALAAQKNSPQIDDYDLK